MSTGPIIARSVLEGFRRGEAEAFAELVRAYTPMVRAIVSRFWSGAFQQEEAMQEIWTRAFRQREALDPSRFDRFGAWLSVLARNRCVDLLRKEGREIGSGWEDPDRALARVEAPAAHDRAAETAELLGAVEAFEARLRPQWRAFFGLHFVEGLGYPEIAARLSIGRARCKYMKRVLVRRAQRDARLMAALGRHMHAGGDHAR
ncbi:MAG: sigma-70 family RNA polymerase sigma factor [Deltaproteobacteria bacterium]|nr:sigma-70 family RNA polymerase sigma factor [Deltaproteobacteria bacterium]